jgi:hypothetical protein
MVHGEGSRKGFPAEDGGQVDKAEEVIMLESCKRSLRSCDKEGPHVVCPPALAAYMDRLTRDLLRGAGEIGLDPLAALAQVWDRGPRTGPEAEKLLCRRLFGLPCQRTESKPHFDRELRILWLDGAVVKRFREPAPNQQLILAAFEEDGWPERIDDAIPPKMGIDSKKRLHATVRHLNERHEDKRMRFFGDGTGEGIGWMPIG